VCTFTRIYTLKHVYIHLLHKPQTSYILKRREYIPTKKGIRRTSRPKESVFGWLRVLKSVNWLEAMGVRQGSGRGINIANSRRSLPSGGRVIQPGFGN
jgi:hypothetical protein